MPKARCYTPTNLAKLLDDAQGGVLGASLDPELAAEITIWGADLAKPLCVLAGVHEENWWNEFAPDEVQMVCSGSKVSGLLRHITSE